MEVLLLPATDPAKERWTGKLLSAGGLTTDCQPDVLRAEAGAKTGISASTIGAFEQLEEVLVRPMREAAVVYMNFPEDMPPGPGGAGPAFRGPPPDQPTPTCSSGTRDAWWGTCGA